MANDKRPIAVDLFCGVGGMSLGFEKAGFAVVGAFDVERRHVDAYQRNFPSTKSFVADLSTATGKSLRSLLDIGTRHIDVVFGGPPCQGFSVGGRRLRRDPRNSLLADFARLVKQLRPSYFVMENVDGLFYAHAQPALDTFVSAIAESGYRLVTPLRTLDASGFGVPQRRRRAFLLGFRRDLPSPAYPEPCGLATARGRHRDPTVRDAITDLPPIEHFPHLFDCDEVAPTNGHASYYARLLRGDVADPLDHSARYQRRANVLTGCLRTRHSPAIVKRFRATRPGFPESVSRYFRLDLDDVAPTIRAGTGADHGSHTAPRPIHPIQPRCITVREAARLHSFPDWFQFDSTRWHGFRQIGNAVPPHLARAVAAQFFSLCAGH